MKERYGSPAFVAEFHRAIQERDSGQAHDTVGFMIDRYLESPEGRRGAYKTVSERVRYAKIIKAEWGKMKLIALNYGAVKGELYAWRDRYADTPRKADEMWAQFRQAVGWAKKRGLVSENPLSNYDALYKSNRSDMVWRKSDMAQLLRHCNPSMQRVYRGTVHLGARMTDIVGLTWTAVHPHQTVWRTSKGKRHNRTAKVPHTIGFRALLAELPRTSTHVFTNESGRPFSLEGLKSNDYRARHRAGLSDLHFHDLRGTKATALAAQNLSNLKIAQQLGWSKSEVDSMVNRYISFNVMDDDWEWMEVGL